MAFIVNKRPYGNMNKINVLSNYKLNSTQTALIIRWASSSIFFLSATLLERYVYIYNIISELTIAEKNTTKIQQSFIISLYFEISVTCNGLQYKNLVYIFNIWLKRTTDNGQATGKLYHLRLQVKCTLFCNLQSQTRTHAVLVIGLYELLGNPTT
jgi:hypothetical protein